MFIAILTLLTSLSLAGVVGLFSIAGVMTIYAGAPFHSALIMGIVMECAKLVSLSWLYRNWKTSSILLRAPLVTIALVIMLITNIGVFGFLSKSHLEQSAATIDNSAKVEQLNLQIEKEKSKIADNEKVIAQLDGAVNSLIGKDQANRSLAVRKSQANQRKQLRDDINSSQTQIDEYNKQKFELESEVRKLQLEVGPIRYVAELFHKNSDAKSIETAVQIFTLLIVLILDPAAVMLLIAANHSFAKIKNEKEKTKPETSTEAGFRHQEQMQMGREQPEAGIAEMEISDHTVLGSETDEFLFDSVESPEIPVKETLDETEIKASHNIPEHRHEMAEPTEVLQSSLTDKTLENFGSLKSLPTQTYPTTFIQTPTITRISDEKDQKENTAARGSTLESNTGSETSGNSQKMGLWNWSRFSDTENPEKIKTLGWIKEFKKE